jgi:tetratricopeptide (TPR) repeat protein
MLSTVKVARESTSGGGLWRWGIPALALAALGILALFGRNGFGSDPDSLSKEARADFEAHRLDAAEAASARLEKLRPPTPQDLMLRADIAFARGKIDVALTALRAIPDSDSSAALARQRAGDAEVRRHRVAKGEALLLEATRLDPSLVQAHRELIYIYGMQLRRPELNREFQALAKLTPLTFDNVWHWCLTRSLLWEPSELVRDLRAWVAADPDDLNSRIALADNARRIGAYAEAERALATLPASDPEARAVRARIALDRGDQEAADALLKEGPKDNPDLSRIRGKLALARRDATTAVRHFREAYAADPDDRDNVIGLAQALTLAGDSKAAEPLRKLSRDFEALGGLVSRVSSNEGRRDPALWRALGAACERVHRLPEARAWYALAIDADPFDEEAQKAIQRLKSRESATP